MTIRRNRFVIVLAVGVAAIAFVWLGNRSDQEPIVQGEPISYWLTAGHNDAEAYQSALAAMDETDVKYLIRLLEWHPPTLQIKLNRWLNPILKRNLFSEERPDYREAAASALGRIGKQADAAIPALRKSVEHRESYQKANRETLIQSAAIAALIKLEADTLDSCIDNILDKQNTNWNALATLYLGTNAAAEVPRLVNAFSESSDDEFRGRFAIPLRFIHSRPELSIPVLQSLLTNRNYHVRFQAAFGLYNFGPAAMPAWNSLTNLLTDPSPWVREAAQSALNQIDPPAARRVLGDQPVGN